MSRSSRSEARHETLKTRNKGAEKSGSKQKTFLLPSLLSDPHPFTPSTSALPDRSWRSQPVLLTAPDTWRPPAACTLPPPSCNSAPS
eukprot:533996-Hanusia_phi.AAC.2